MTSSTLRSAAKSPWLTFAVCALAAYLTTLDLSIVNVAFPEILSEFGASRADASWVVTIYNICFASLLVVAGKSADQLGRRRFFLAGVTVFGVGSLICAFAPSLGLLISGRAVQGIGGALLTPASLGLLLAAFPTERRTQVVALWGGIGALGVASGPSIGAALITATDWRAAFWVNLPICVGLIIFGRRQLVETPRVVSDHRPDYAGAAMITLALGALALGLSQTESWGWIDARTLACFTVTAVTIPLFVGRQRHHPEPVLDLSLFEHRSFRIANVGGLVFFAGFAALGLNNVLFLRQAWGYTVLHAGLLSALAPLTVALLAPIAGRLASRHGFRPFLIAGPLLVTGSMIAFYVLLDGQPTPWLFVAIGELSAVGIAAFIPVNAAAAVSQLPPLRLSIGGAVSNTSRQVGSVVGVALLVAVLGAPASHDALVAAHHRGFLVIATAMLMASIVSTGQPRLHRTPAVVAEPVEALLG